MQMEESIRGEQTKQMASALFFSNIKHFDIET